MTNCRKITLICSECCFVDSLKTGEILSILAVVLFAVVIKSSLVTKINKYITLIFLRP